MINNKGLSLFQIKILLKYLHIYLSSAADGPGPVLQNLIMFYNCRLLRSWRFLD
jgi:hypothetical protein